MVFFIKNPPNKISLSAPKSFGYFKMVEGDILPSRLHHGFIDEKHRLSTKKPMKLLPSTRAVSLSLGAALFFMIISLNLVAVDGAIKSLAGGISLFNKTIDQTYVAFTAPIEKTIATVAVLNTYDQKIKNQSTGISTSRLALSSATFDGFFSRLGSFFSRLGNWLINLWQTILNKWQEFLGTNRAPIVSPANATITPELLAEIKKTVAGELAKSLNGAKSVDSSVDKNSAGFGVVVVPSAGTAESEVALKKNLADQFSDPVEVQFDSSGRAGVIKPNINGAGKNSDYVFLLTPIKSSGQ